VTAGERCYALGLSREAWQGRAALAWVPAQLYAVLALSPGDFLGPEETDIFATYEHERRKASYLLGRYAAKVALGQLLDTADRRSIDVVAGCFQQPIVVAATASPVGVGITHSTKVACAVAFPEQHPMGIDVEEIDSSRAEVMKTQFVARELQAMRALQDDDATLCAVVWTAKEALSKILRCGMTAPFELFEVDALARTATGYAGVFHNFVQHRFRSWVRDGAVISLVFPRRTRLGLDADFLS
jgi:4'-phosphopantetheinyl transferase